MIRQATAMLLGGLAVAIAASAAVAQPPAVQQGWYSINTQNGAQEFAATQVGALPGTILHPNHVMESVDANGLPHVASLLNPIPTSSAQEHADLQALQASTAAIVTALGAPLQTGGGVSVTSSALPTGAATSAGQVAAQTSLGAIAINTGASATAALQASGAAQAHMDASAIVAAVQAGVGGTGGSVTVTSSVLPAGAATSAGQATAQTSLTSIASNTAAGATAANQTTELTRLASIVSNTASPAYPAATSTAVSGAFTTSTAPGTASAAFTPVAGRPFNIAVWASATPGTALGGTVYLARSTDGATTYLPLTASGAQLESFTATASDSWSESQTGVTYELVCASVPTGTINYRVSQ